MRKNDLFTPAVSEFDLTAIVEILSDIRDFMGCPPQAAFETIEGYGLKITGRITDMDLREGQRVQATVALKTASGKPAAYETGSAKWTSSADAVVNVTATPDNELSAWITGLDGSANTPVLISFTCDGDPDAGPDQVRDIIATLDVVCTQGEAMVAEITTGTPEDAPVVNPLDTKKK